MPALPRRPAAETVQADPVDFEVIRHSLLLANDENAATILATSGSPTVVHGRDFNAALLTADGEYVFFGRYMQNHAGVIDLAVQYIVDSPGLTGPIRDGDMFVTNDPWIACGHANDIVVLAPVVVDGSILCWAGNTLHHIDVGGGSPGSRDVNAESAFQEPALLPLLRLVRGGEFQPDIAALMERHSRLPDYLALDIRAQVAGNRVASERVKRLVERYGRATVESVMAGVIRRCESAFLRKLRLLPDGTWRERTYMDGKKVGDRHVYRVGTRLTKRGDLLTIADDGSDEQQAAPVNCTVSAWRTGIVSALLAQMGQDTPFAPVGILRHLRLEPKFGTILNANFPSPVNRGTGVGAGFSCALTLRLLARMLVCSPELRRDVISVSGHEPVITLGLTGKRRAGSSFLRVYTETGADGGFALWDRDGVATSGSTVNVGAGIPNVEDVEESGVTLYLHRRQERDSGGAGRTRGGNGISFSLATRETSVRRAHVFGSGVAFPAFSGVFGGYPGGNRRVVRKTSTDVWRILERGRLPGSIEGLGGDEVILPSKMQDLAFDESDVMFCAGGGGTGFGDPLERDPNAVARDVAEGICSTDAARRLYGVVVGPRGQLDAEATQERRSAIRRERLGGTPPSRVPSDAAPVDRGPHVRIAMSDGRYVCARCRQDLGPASDWYTSYCAKRTRPPAEIGLLDPADFVDVDIVVTEYSCPSCASLFEVDVAPRDDALPVGAIDWTATTVG